MLIKAARGHVQFETIHPFLDGNGRVGRLLLTLLLAAAGVLSQPSLSLSLYFKSHRAAYYRHLQAVRTEGDWEGWLAFFLDGVYETSQAAASTAQRLLRLFDDDRERLRTIGRRAGSALQLHEWLQGRPILSVVAVASSIRTCRIKFSADDLECAREPLVT